MPDSPGLAPIGARRLAAAVAGSATAFFRCVALLTEPEARQPLGRLVFLGADNSPPLHHRRVMLVVRPPGPPGRESGAYLEKLEGWPPRRWYRPRRRLRGTASHLARQQPRTAAGHSHYGTVRLCSWRARSARVPSAPSFGLRPLCTCINAARGRINQEG